MDFTKIFNKSSLCKNRIFLTFFKQLFSKEANSFQFLDNSDDISKYTEELESLDDKNSISDESDKSKSDNLEKFLSNVRYLISFFENNPIDLSINPNGNKINIQSYPKFLTNPQLFNRQLNDSSFRRIILLQIIIVYNSFLRPISQIQKKYFVFNNRIINIIKEDIERCMKILSKAKHKNINIMKD